MKKLLSMILAVAMMFALATTVFAVEENVVLNGSGVGDQDKNVQIQVNHGGIVYYVNIDWESTLFTYSYGDWETGLTDDATYRYADGSWDKTAAEVKVVNHSNDAIEYTAEYTNDPLVNIYGVVVTLTPPDGKTATELSTTGIEIEAPEVGDELSSKNSTFKITIADVEPTGIIGQTLDATTIGTVTVSIAPYTP